MKILNSSFKSILLVYILLLKLTLGLSTPSYQFKHFNINNGLSQNTVSSIFQDKEGYMWFGTKDGLNRFDGVSFKIFRLSSENKLNDNVFRVIVQDKDDNIWLGTDDGVYIYNPQLESFKFFDTKTKDNDSIRGLISDMIIDTDGDVWISVEEKKVFMYNYETNELDLYIIESEKGGLKGLSLFEDKDYGVWVFPYSRPIHRIDKNRKVVSEFKLKPDNSEIYQTGEINSVIADGNNLLVGTSQKGLIKIDIIDRTISNILSTDKSGNPIFARDLLRINETIWIASESGIYFFNIYTGELENLKFDPSLSTSL